MNRLIYSYGDNFYVFKGIAYDRHFPIEWAMNPRELDNDFTCGPTDCLNCLHYGSYNGVFIGYCANCAQVYDYQRGNGFIDSGEEFKHEGFYDENSVWNTYLKYVNLDEIGFLSQESLSKVSVLCGYDEYFEHFQMNLEEHEDKIPWMNCEIDNSEEEEEEDKKFEPIYHYDYEHFEEGPPPLTMEDLSLEEEKEEKKLNDCVIN